MKLSKKDQVLFNLCRLHCLVCSQDGGCSLQKKYLKAVEKKVKQNEIKR